MSDKEPIWEKLPFPIVAIGGAILAPIIIPFLIIKMLFESKRIEKRENDKKY